MPTLDLSVVIPMYDEAEVLPQLIERLRPVLDDLDRPYEVVAVDDGSTDQTAVRLAAARRSWPELRIVRLRTNAGHQAAISAGLARARGDYVVTMDADLQDPPEVVPLMLRTVESGSWDIVQGVRSDRSSDTAFKRVTARLFYRLLGAIAQAPVVPDAGDFRLMSRATVNAVNGLPEHHRVLRFLVPELGFPTTSIPYRREPRIAGTSKYPLWRMVRLSLDSVTGFSILPLRLATIAGVVTAATAAVMIAYILVARGNGHTVAGWTSTVVIVAGFSAVQLLSLGVIGEYLARMYIQIQGRPTYYVAHDSLDADAEALNGPGKAAPRPAATES